MSEWGAFMVGVLITATALFVIFGRIVAVAYERRNVAEIEVVTLSDKVKHLESKVNPREWLNETDVAVNIATKERIYDKYPELIKPGDEVIVIEDEDE